MKARVESAKYQFNHGHAPWGRGSWAFHPDFNLDVLSREILWVHGRKFGPAAQQAAEHFGKLGFDSVEVLP